MSRKAISLLVIAFAAMIALAIHRLAAVDRSDSRTPVRPAVEAHAGPATLGSSHPVDALPTPVSTTTTDSRRLDRTELAAALDSPDDAIRLHAIETLFARFADQDFYAALDLIEAVGSPAQRARMRQILGAGLARKDRGRALAWVSSLQDAVEREDAMAVVLGEISMTDPAAAVRLRQEASLPAGDDPVLENLTQRWAESDLHSALQWADSLPPGDQRDHVTARAAYVQAQASPEAAATLIMDRMSPGLAQEEALISVLHQWAQRDLGAAQIWVKQMTPGPVRVRAGVELAAMVKLRTGSSE